MNDAGITFNRFQNDPAYQRGFEEGDRILDQGTLVLGWYGCTVSTDPYDPESEIESASDQDSDLENGLDAMDIVMKIPMTFLENKAIVSTASVGRLRFMPKGITMSIRYVEQGNMIIWFNSLTGLSYKIRYVLPRLWKWKVLAGILNWQTLVVRNPQGSFSVCSGGNFCFSFAWHSSIWK